MEIIIKVLMLFIVINCIIKLSFWKWWQMTIFSCICSVFVILTCQFAITQSKTQLVDYLNNVQVMQDMAVIITLESSICFAFCFVFINKIYGKKIKIWQKALNWYPSLLIFPVLFYALTQSIFAMPGTDFNTTSYALAVITLVGIPALGILFKHFLKEEDLRMEIYFLVSLFISIIGLITTVNGNTTYSKVQESFNPRILLMSLSLFLGTFLIGFFWSRFKIRFLSKHK